MRIIPPMLKLLIQLTYKSDRTLITIPKIISIANNLLANSSVRPYAILALKSLAYEIFFMNVNVTGVPSANTTTTRVPLSTPMGASFGAPPMALEEAAAAAESYLASERELETQKEVILGMLEKFIDSSEIQQVLALLLLHEVSIRMWEQNQQQQQQQQQFKSSSMEQTVTAAATTNRPLAIETGSAYAIICRSLCEEHIRLDDWNSFLILEAFFQNNGKSILAHSKEFLSLLHLLISKVRFV